MRLDYKSLSRAGIAVLLTLLVAGCTRVQVPQGAAGNLTAAQGLYLVYKINGKIARSSGNWLQKGDKLSESEQLRFVGADASALVCNLGTGQRYVLQAATRETQDGESEKTGLLRDNLAPDTGPRRISSRAVTVHFQPLTLVSDLTGGAAPDTTLPVLFFQADTLDVRFVQPGDQFYVAFEWQHQLIPKKLAQVNGKFVLHIPDLLSVDYLPVQLASTHHWRLVWEPAGERPKTLVFFKPVLADSVGVAEELDLLVPALQAAGKSSTAILNETWAFLAAHYARPVASQFEAFMRARYQLTATPVADN